jgi:hypothetical protein
MNTNENSSALKTRKMILSTLWIFIMFHYLYCDVISNMESSVLKGYLEGHVGSIQVNQEFMLGAALLMEIPIVMVFLSRILMYRPNRWANIIAGTFMIVVQISSFSFGTPPTLHYIFYSVIEVACAAFIVVFAWKWCNQDSKPEESN